MNKLSHWGFVNAWRWIQTRTLEEAESVADDLHGASVCVTTDPDEADLRYTSIKQMIVTAAGSGRLMATGLETPHSPRRQIPATDWIDLSFTFERDQPVASFAHGSKRGIPAWWRVKFPAKQVQQEWPARDPVSEWLTRTELEIDVIARLAKCAGGQWHLLLRSIKAACRRDGLRYKSAATDDKIDRFSTVTLADLWAHASDRPEDERAWNLLRDFCQRWAQVKGIELTVPTRRRTIAAAKECERWLIAMMVSGAKRQPKTTLLAEAKSRFGISVRQFNDAWARAISETGNTAWSKSGPRS